MKKVVERFAVQEGTPILLDCQEGGRLVVSRLSTVRPSGFDAAQVYVTVEVEIPEPRIEVTPSKIREVYERLCERNANRIWNVREEIVKELFGEDA